MTTSTEQRAKAATLAALLTPVAVGLIYVAASCERYSPGPGKCESQWVTALAIGGMGGAWSAGFWQPNQALRERDRRLILDGGPLPAGAPPEGDGDGMPGPALPIEPTPELLPEPLADGDRDPLGAYDTAPQPVAEGQERFTLDELQRVVQLLRGRA